MSKIKNLVDD